MPKVSLEALFSDMTSERNIDTRKSVAYGTQNRQMLDIYEPSQASSDGRSSERPIIIFYYGGAWTSGDRSYYGFVGSAFAKRGFTTVIPDYRLYPEVAFPEFVADAALAYAWVANHLAGTASGQRPIFIVGHSAGAHTAALLAFDEHYLKAVLPPQLPRPAGLIGLSGPYVFDPTTWASTQDIFKSAAGHPDVAKPIAQVTVHAPPTLLVHGESDETVTVDATRQLYHVLRMRGIDATKIEYPNVGHVGLILTLSRPFRWRADVLDQSVAFVTRHAKSARRDQGPRANGWIPSRAAAE